MTNDLLIFVLGSLSVWLSQSPRYGARKWGALLGLASQPVFLFAAWKAQQWGLAALSLVYALAWARGIKTYWMDPHDFHRY